MLVVSSIDIFKLHHLSESFWDQYIFGICSLGFMTPPNIEQLRHICHRHIVDNWHKLDSIKCDTTPEFNAIATELNPGGSVKNKNTIKPKSVTAFFIWDLPRLPRFIHRKEKAEAI